MKKEKWITLEYSKTAVRKAGDSLRILTSDSISEEQLNILSNWRSSHAYPMQCMLTLLRHLTVKVDTTGIVVQRLKRLRSIESKLIKMKTMSLDRMQDIAGCRVVVENIKKVHELQELLIKSRTRHKLFKENDYITNPKKSGYRGRHLIYKYNATKGEYKDFLVEIQLRSKIQHSWATAVEVVETFTGEPLKSGQGNKKWLSFFRCVSKLFAMLEDGNIPFNPMFSESMLIPKTMSLMNQLNIKTFLQDLPYSFEFIDRKKDKDDYFFILKLDAWENRISYRSFTQKQIKKASDDYLSLEKEFKGNNYVNVVLVSASSINNLKKAYPNYFADTKDFLENLNQIFTKQFTRTENKITGKRRAEYRDNSY